MGSSPPPSSPSSLTKLQGDLLDAFFEREQRFFLTGGGALAGFYFGHRTTEDLDFFTPPGTPLEEGERAIEGAATAAGAVLERVRTYPEFRRVRATRGDEACVVDLVVDRAPMIEPNKATFGNVRVDTLREIAANKISALLGRSEIKDLVDLERLLASGVDLERALEDAQRKDASADAASLAWVLDPITIGPEAALPGGADPVKLAAFCRDLVKRLRALALREARRT